MKTDVAILSAALAYAINGESAPSFKSAEFSETMAAASRLTDPSTDDYQAEDMARIGIEAVKLIAARLLSSMHSERALAMMRSH